jgi:uncharacterized membrane protein (UPF0182 family)
VVDAYNGSVDFYVVDDSDPLIAAYAKIYPGLFHSLQTMPSEIRKHIRYPRDLFSTQMTIFERYHQEDPLVFYRGQDLWEPMETSREEGGVYQPRYVTANLIEPYRLDFSCMVPMSPRSRQNMRAIVAVGCDPPDYGRIVVHSLPRGRLAFGFGQIDGLINEEPAISRQFTLWDQEGSKVIRGNIIAVPVASRILYVQPVFLEATEAPVVPQLERIIMSEGTVAVMGETLEDTYAKLMERIDSESSSS